MKATLRGIRNRAAAVLAAIVLALSQAGMAGMTALAADSTAVSEAAEGVARLFVVLTDTYYYQTTYSDGSIILEPETVAVGLSTGTAFGIGTVGEETDTFVTNRHVVTNDEYEVGEIWLLLDSKAVEYSYDMAYYYDADGKKTSYLTLSYSIDESLAIRCDIEYLGDEEYPDIAIVKTRQSSTGRTALELKSIDELSVGDTIWAIGYPGDSDDISMQETNTGYKYNLAADVSDATLTTGIVSRITTSALFGNTEVIQHTASISSGNSGGPLLTEDGAVTGINTYGYSGDETDYYAVSIDYVIEVCENNDIPYNVYPDSDDEIPIVPVAIAVVIVVVLIAVVVLSRKRTAKTAPGEQAGAQTQNSSGTQAQNFSGSNAQNASGAQAQNASGAEPAAQTTPQRMEEAGAAPEPAAQTAPAAASNIPGDSGLRIQAMSGAFAGRRFAIVNQVRIGRDPNRNDIVYPADTKGISGVHCVVGVTNGQVTLMDLGSTYGTYLAQGQRLAANQPVTLRVGDTFYLATKDETFVITRKGGI